MILQPNCPKSQVLLKLRLYGRSKNSVILHQKFPKSQCFPKFQIFTPLENVSLGAIWSKILLYEQFEVKNAQKVIFSQIATKIQGIFFYFFDLFDR